MQTYSKPLISLVSVCPCRCVSVRELVCVVNMCICQPSWLADYPQSIKIYLVIYNAKQGCIGQGFGWGTSGRLRTEGAPLLFPDHVY